MLKNDTGLSLSLAVWLADDAYDYISDPLYISVTTLMRPVKQMVLARRVTLTEECPDVVDFVARSLGQSIHTSIETAWVHNFAANLRKLGTPENDIKRVVINPTDEEIPNLPEDAIPLYFEQRATRKVGKYTIGGKFDMVAEGHVEDFKSTSVYAWIYGTRDAEHIQQGSLYRWVDAVRKYPRITEDFVRINYVFTDWKKSGTRGNDKYPSHAAKHKDHELLSLQDTNAWVEAKVAEFDRYKDSPEDQIPRCTDEDLWRSAPQYRYFADASKAKDPAARSSKNFDNPQDAAAYAAKAGKGIVVVKPGEVKRCLYCQAAEVCEQRKEYFDD